MARGGEALAAEHLRRTPLQPRAVRLHCMVLDCSASMVTSGALARAKGVLLGLLEEAYQRREQVALICFGGAGVELRLPPSRAAHWNEEWVAPIGGGGGTPLVQALGAADDLLRMQALRLAALQGWLWLMTDARTRERPARPAYADEIRILDFESSRAPLRRAQQLAQDWRAHYQPVSA